MKEKIKRLFILTLTVLLIAFQADVVIPSYAAGEQSDVQEIENDFEGKTQAVPDTFGESDNDKRDLKPGDEAGSGSSDGFGDAGKDAAEGKTGADTDMDVNTEKDSDDTGKDAAEGKTGADTDTDVNTEKDSDDTGEDEVEEPGADTDSDANTEEDSDDIGSMRGITLNQLQENGSITRYEDSENQTLNDSNTTYEIYGRNDGSRVKNGEYFTVPSNCSNESSPIKIILDGVNRTQNGESPDSSFITIESGNYVVIKLRGNNFIEAGEDRQIGSNDGMAGIHVSKESTVFITSEEGDGKTDGTLEVHGGGGKYGGAGIGTRYNNDSGTIIIAGGTINAYGGHCAPGIGSGRDGKAMDIQIKGGQIYAEGGEFAPGIGGGDNVGGGEGGNLVNLSITGGDITAVGGAHAAGIGCSEGAHLEGQITIQDAVIRATGGTQGAGIGGGDGADFKNSDSKISISSGDITATGGDDGAGIGGGNHTKNVRVTINQEAEKDLNITATGGKNAAGIGAGDADGDFVDITLRGGSITAYGGHNGAGIGAGDNVNRIRVKGSGTIKAYGGQTAAGIGGGNDSTVKNELSITGDTNNQIGNRGEASEGSRGLDITAVVSNGVEPGGGYDNEGAAIGGGKSKWFFRIC